MVGALLVDQGIKQIFLAGWRWDSRCISLHLVFNTGVAFSMFAFLGPWLKWLQLLLLSVVLGVVVHGNYLRRYGIPIGILFGAGLSNVMDRFAHGGVVDYVDWHCGFDFAIFNAADVMIDLAVLWILVLNFKKNKMNEPV